MRLRLPVDDTALAAFCQRNHIRELAFFGSALRDDFGPESDVDVVVEFEPGRTPGLEFVQMSIELSTLVGGRRVDLVTKRALHPSLRDRVLKDAEVRYAA